MTQELVLADDFTLARRAFDLHGAQLECAWLSAHGHRHYSSDFLEKGYFAFAIPPQVAAALMGFFDDRLQRPFEQRDVHPHYFGMPLPAQVVARLNSENIYYAPP